MPNLSNVSPAQPAPDDDTYPDKFSFCTNLACPYVPHTPLVPVNPLIPLCSVSTATLDTLVLSEHHSTLVLSEHRHP